LLADLKQEWERLLPVLRDYIVLSGSSIGSQKD